MKKMIVMLFAFFTTWTANAQGGLKKVYNEDLNPIEQIDQALQQAKKAGKFVACQVGGNWCPWCLRFADFITNDNAVSQVVDENFVYIHVNYNPRKSADPAKTEQAKAMLKRLGQPARFGFPVIVVLDADGKSLAHSGFQFLRGGPGLQHQEGAPLLPELDSKGCPPVSGFVCLWPVRESSFPFPFVLSPHHTPCDGYSE